MVQRKASFLRYNKYQPQEAVFSVSDTGTFRRLDEAPPGSGRIAAAALEIATLPWHQRQFPGDCVRAGTHRDRKTDRSAADDGGGKFARSATPMGSTTKLVGDKTPDEKIGKQNPIAPVKVPLKLCIIPSCTFLCRFVNYAIGVMFAEL
ncbi:unnamed protein product [Bemisia tabaci]|uniref:Uncharacterized protein n=1 Tax=Bemisia tabaci TaxID=7038 RepID=A0A9P0A9X5_BEMTA|nr:unnamed protein product [Bemisia tabaci]